MTDAQESWWEQLTQDAFIDVEADAKMFCLGDDSEADDMDEEIINQIIQEDDDDTD